MEESSLACEGLSSKGKLWQDLRSLLESASSADSRWQVLAEAGNIKAAVPAARDWLLRHSAEFPEEHAQLICALATFSEEGDELAVQQICQWALTDTGDPSVMEVTSGVVLFAVCLCVCLVSYIRGSECTAMYVMAVIWSLEKLYRYGQRFDANVFNILCAICCESRFDVRNVREESLITAASLLLVLLNSTGGQSAEGHLPAACLVQGQIDSEITQMRSSATGAKVEHLCRLIQDRLKASVKLSNIDVAHALKIQLLCQQFLCKFSQQFRATCDLQREAERTDHANMTYKRSLWHLIGANASESDSGEEGQEALGSFSADGLQEETIMLLSGLEHGELRWLNHEGGGKSWTGEEEDIRMITSKCRELVCLPPELFDMNLRELTHVRRIEAGDPREELVGQKVYKEQDFYRTRTALFEMERSERSVRVTCGRDSLRAGRYAYEFRSKPQGEKKQMGDESVVADLWSGNEVR
eukprot:748167-Hanusia_phi.AAC.3